MPEAARLTRGEESVLRSLRRIIRAVGLHSRQLERTHDLTTPQLLCLRHLLRHGASCAGDLAAAASLSQPTLTGILDRLESRALVVRQRSTEDRRKVLVELTAAGNALAEQAPSPLQERFAGRFAALPVARRRELERALAEIVEMMEAGDVEASLILDSEPTLDEPAGRPTRRGRRRPRGATARRGSGGRSVNR